METAPTILEVSHVSKTFTRRVGRRRRGQPLISTLKVLDDINLDAKVGEFITVIGPSGCGKTTLLRAISGLESFDEGTIVVDGEAISRPGPERAVVFQSALLFPWRTVANNIAYGLQRRHEFSKSTIAERVQRAIDLVGLTGFEHHYPHEISGGMQQRANLARALVVEPLLILMDEPFASLDALTKALLQDELSDLASRMHQTAIFVTHDIDEAVFLGDTVVAMSANPGRIVERVDVPFARPRTRDVAEGPEFRVLVKHLRELLHPPRAAVTAE